MEQVGDKIAIIGMGGRFPQSPNLETYWRNLENSCEMISTFTEAELREEGIEPTVFSHKNYVKAKGILNDVDCFDAELFGYHQREAECMDPQQRIMLETAWETFEHSGYDPEKYEGRIGVFIGSNPSSYYLSNLIHHHNSTLYDELSLLIGNGHDYLATRLSYKFNLKGPSQTIQTACSTSLVAVHHACQSLLNYECDMALGGGVSVTIPNKSGYLYTAEGINSPDGHCRPFDQKAAGTIFGDGIGLVLLKRLEDALEDHDTIHAVIRGSSLNNDGRRKVGFLAPSVDGQAEVIASSQAIASTHPDQISFVEAHGTGTNLGDPIEFSALTQAFRLKTNRERYCALGSVKSNIGHCITAAGIASLIKTILALKHKKIPSTLHFKNPNQKINFVNSPFYIPSETEEWKTDFKRIAGVSSFGMGGTNVHLIIEEFPQNLPSECCNYCVLPFSAKNPSILKNLLGKFSSALAEVPYSLTDIAYTLQMGRKPLEIRTYFVGHTKQEIVQQIQAYLEGKQLHSTSNVNDHPYTQKLHQLGQDWLEGRPCDWKRFHANYKRQRVPLPTYPFAKDRFWINLPSQTFVKNSMNQETSSLFEANIEPNNMILFIIQMIWKHTLGVKNISPDSNFFDLGGDSLAAIEIIAKIRSYFNIEISIQQLYTQTSLKSFSNYILEIIHQR